MGLVEEGSKSTSMTQFIFLALLKTRIQFNPPGLSFNGPVKVLRNTPSEWSFDSTDIPPNRSILFQKSYFLIPYQLLRILPISKDISIFSSITKDCETFVCFKIRFLYGHIMSIATFFYCLSIEGCFMLKAILVTDSEHVVFIKSMRWYLNFKFPSLNLKIFILSFFPCFHFESVFINISIQVAYPFYIDKLVSWFLALYEFDICNKIVFLRWI